MQTTIIRTRLFAGLLSLAGMGSAQEITWAELPVLAHTAPLARAGRSQAGAAMAKTGALDRSFQPRLSVAGSAQAGAFNDEGKAWPELKADLDWNFWRGGRDRAASRSLDSGARLAALKGLAAREDTLLELRNTFLRASLAHRKTAILEESVIQSQEDLAKARRKAAAGFTSQLDVREFELRLISLKTEKARLEDEMEQSLAVLARLAGLSGAELSDSHRSWPDEVQAPSAPGLTERMLGLEAEIIRWDSRALGSWPRPGLDLGFRLNQGGAAGAFSDQRDARAFAALSLPLWDAGEASAARKSLAKSEEALQALIGAEKTARETSLTLARKKLARWLAMRELLKDGIDAALRLREGVLQEYLKGVRDGRDLEEATKAVHEAKVEMEEARVAAWSAWSSTQRLVAGE